MPYQDFRQFLDVLRQQGELIDVDRPIALTDVGKALKQAYQKGRPAVSFNDNGTEFPLVCGVYSDRNKALLAFQSDEKTILQKVLDGLDHPIAPRMVKGPAPCHEVVITGDDIDINRFPIPTYSPKDGGPTSRRASWCRRTPRRGCRTSATTAFSFWARTASRSRRSRSTASARTWRSARRWASRPRPRW